MNELFKLILKLSISGSIFFLLFYNLSFFTKRIFSAKWYYKAIKFNMIFFIFPIVYIYDFFTKNIEGTINVNPVNFIFTEVVESSSSIQIGDYLSFIWILGVFIISLWNIYCYKRFTKHIFNSTYEDKQLEHYILNCKNNLEISSDVLVRRSNIIKTPMVIGILNKTIIIPKDMEITPRIEPVIFHELTHLKRNDILFKIFQLAILIINWFNPIVYLMSSTFEKWCEISCDEIVAKDMNYGERKEYGETILSIIEKTSVAENNMCFYLCSDKKYIKRRLLMMLNLKKDSNLIKIGGLILISSIILLSAKVSISWTTSNITSKDFKDINIVGKTYDDALSAIQKSGLLMTTNDNSTEPELIYEPFNKKVTIEEDGIGITIEAKDQINGELLKSLALEKKNGYVMSKSEKMSFIVIDPATGEELGRCTFK